MAPTYALVYNTTDSPIVVDSNGRTVGGHEWSPARRGAELDAAANAGGIAVLTTIDEESASDDARAAWHQVIEWTAAAEKWQQVPADVARDVASRQLDEATGPADADQVDLVDMLVRNGIPIPARAKRTSSPQE